LAVGLNTGQAQPRNRNRLLAIEADLDRSVVWLDKAA
jgi:hypothetical protein